MNRSVSTWRDLGAIVEGTSPRITERCVNAAGTQILAASIASISQRIFEITLETDDDPNQIVEEVGTAVALTVADVWSDAYIVDGGWQSPLGGYNVSYIIAAAKLLAGDGVPKRYQIETRATPVTGAVFYVTKARLNVVDAQSV